MLLRKRLVLSIVFAALPASLLACQGWDPRQPFEHDSPQVRAATEAYDAGDASAAAAMLTDYLGTGPCKDGQIGTPNGLAEKREGTFDLGLALFAIGETYGARFQDAPNAPKRPGTDDKLRGEWIGCAMRITRAVIEAPDTSYALRARAHYLEGNLHFLSGKYPDAVKSYERALVIVPGEVDAGDQVGRDAAWNRAVALRRIEDQKDAGPDGGSSDGGGDNGGDSGAGGGNDDAGKDAGKDKSKDGGSDSGKDDKQDKKDKDKNEKDPSGQGKDAGSSPQQENRSQDPNDQNGEQDAGAQNEPQEKEQQTGQPAGAATPDERVLDALERAPLLQHELSRRAAANRKVRGSADK